MSRPTTRSSAANPNPTVSSKSNCSWEIPPQELKEESNNNLGEGGYAIVKKALWKGQPVAVKKFLLKKATQRTLSNFKRELDITWNLRHPCIVQVFGGFCEPDNLYLVLEFMGGGDLYSLLHNDDIQLSWPKRIKFLRDIAAGLAQLHSQKIVHRDIKSHNILLDASREHAKLSDFGLAAVKTETETKVTKQKSSIVEGTFRWMAPELFRGVRESTAADMWSFGALCAEVATRSVPYEHMRDEALRELLVRNPERLPAHEVPDDCPVELRELIQGCQKLDTAKRTTADEAYALLESICSSDNDHVPAVSVRRNVPSTTAAKSSASSTTTTAAKTSSVSVAAATTTTAATYTTLTRNTKRTLIESFQGLTHDNRCAWFRP